MKRPLLFLVAIYFAVLNTGVAYAIPTLQLDISDGVYRSSDDTIVATGDFFTLYALLYPDSKNTLSDTYYISCALTPKQPEPTSPSDMPTLGSFIFAGTTVNVTQGMVYGVPPLELTYVNSVPESLKDPGDLATHDIYETYFKEFGFQFVSSQRATPYNTADNPGGLTPNENGSLYYAQFTVDVSNLADNYNIHFDLYNEKFAKKDGSDIDISQFAPFSHDAESGGAPVPEPATLLLLGSGLLGVAGLRRKVK